MTSFSSTPFRRPVWANLISGHYASSLRITCCRELAQPDRLRPGDCMIHFGRRAYGRLCNYDLDFEIRQLDYETLQVDVAVRNAHRPFSGGEIEATLLDTSLRPLTRVAEPYSSVPLPLVIWGGAPSAFYATLFSADRMPAFLDIRVGADRRTFGPILEDAGECDDDEELPP